MLADRFPRGPPVPAAKCWRAMGSDWGLKKSVRRGIGCRTICDRKNLTAHTTSFLFLFLRVCIGPHGIPIMKTKSLFLFLSLFLLFFGGNRLSTSEKDFPGRWWGGTRPAAFACNRLYTVKTKTTDQSGRRACFLRLLYHFFFCQRKKETDFFSPKKDGFSVTAWPESANIIPLFVAVYLNEDGQEQRQLVDGPPTLHRCFCFTIRSLVDETVDTTAASEPASEEKKKI